MHLTLLPLGRRKSIDQYVKNYILNFILIYNTIDSKVLTDNEFILYVLFSYHFGPKIFIYYLNILYFILICYYQKAPLQSNAEALYFYSNPEFITYPIRSKF